MLDASPSFGSRFRTEQVPAVHEITEATLGPLWNVISQASLIVTHRVEDGYHGLPIGSAEIARLSPEACRIVTIPALYYNGVYPFQAFPRNEHVHIPGLPLLGYYQDLRFLWCAAQGWDADEAKAWLRGFKPLAEGLRAVAAYALRVQNKREELLDVRVIRELTAPGLHPHSFFTVNHPTDAALLRVVAGVHEHLSLPYEAAGFGQGLLGCIRTPLEEDVIDALGLGVKPRPNWLVDSETYSIEQMLEIHVDWYLSHPDVVAAGMSQYERRMRVIGLPI